jgi:hypothetical protein
MYGLEDESLKHITEERRGEVVREVMRLCDANRNGVVERDEWMRYSHGGGKLPDFGVHPYPRLQTTKACSGLILCSWGF